MEQLLLKYTANIVFLDLNYEDTETPIFYQTDRVRAMGGAGLQGC
jgi:hypothetical protein